MVRLDRLSLPAPFERCFAQEEYLGEISCSCSVPQICKLSAGRPMSCKLRLCHLEILVRWFSQRASDCNLQCGTPPRKPGLGPAQSALSKVFTNSKGVDKISKETRFEFFTKVPCLAESTKVSPENAWEMWDMLAKEREKSAGEMIDWWRMGLLILSFSLWRRSLVKAALCLGACGYCHSNCWHYSVHDYSLPGEYTRWRTRESWDDLLKQGFFSEGSSYE